MNGTFSNFSLVLKELFTRLAPELKDRAGPIMTAATELDTFLNPHDEEAR